jgi:hypothetical protein
MEKIEVVYVYDKVESREHILDALRKIIMARPQPTAIKVSIEDYEDNMVYEAQVTLGELSLVDGPLEREAELGVDN